MLREIYVCVSAAMSDDNTRELAPHDQSNGDRVCLSVCLSVCVCVCVHRTFTFRIYARSNLTQMCNISLVQSDSTSRVQVRSQYSTAR